ncbi:MAG: hypothetical protein LBP31_03640 [Holosporales bacterium]|jgi:hypothetical protein|nr:hypothetical protein [Holosporales bacterium]
MLAISRIVAIFCVGYSGVMLAHVYSSDQSDSESSSSVDSSHSPIHNGPKNGSLPNLEIRGLSNSPEEYNDPENRSLPNPNTMPMLCPPSQLSRPLKQKNPVNASYQSKQQKEDCFPRHFQKGENSKNLHPIDKPYTPSPDFPDSNRITWDNPSGLSKSRTSNAMSSSSFSEPLYEQGSLNKPKTPPSTQDKDKTGSKNPSVTTKKIVSTKVASTNKHKKK